MERLSELLTPIELERQDSIIRRCEQQLVNAIRTSGKLGSVVLLTTLFPPMALKTAKEIVDLVIEKKEITFAEAKTRIELQNIIKRPPQYSEQEVKDLLDKAFTSIGSVDNPMRISIDTANRHARVFNLDVFWDKNKKHYGS